MIRQLIRAGVVILVVLAIGGCCDNYKKQIDELTLDRQDLEGQLSQLKNEIDSKQAELTNCQDQLSSSEGTQSKLQKELEDARKLAAKIPAGWEIRKGMAMTSLSDAVLFDSGRTNLKPGAASKLDRVIQQIKAKFPGKDVYVVGHTDSDPIRKSKWKDNLDLSLNRASAVARYMMAHGLRPKQVLACGAGKYRPIASNKSLSGKAKIVAWSSGY